MNKLDLVYMDVWKVKNGELTYDDFKRKHPKVKKENFEKTLNFINVQDVLGDIAVLIRDSDMTERSKDKLVEFSDVLIKTYYEDEKISISKLNERIIISIKEAKLSYKKKDDKLKLLRVVFYTKGTIKKEEKHG